MEGTGVLIIKRAKNGYALKFSTEGEVNMGRAVIQEKDDGTPDKCFAELGAELCCWVLDHFKHNRSDRYRVIVDVVRDGD